jgi:hypothetical protein
MKRNLCLFFWLLVAFAAHSQKTFFAYIQAESNQPFFVKMGDKNYNSSSSGYIILSNLVDSTYSIGIGFTRGQIAEQKFTLKPENKDQGYLLRNFGEKGWGLFNLQTMVVQMSTSGQGGNNEIKEQAKVSAFTDILAKAANDPSLLERKVEPAQKMAPPLQKEIKPDTILKSLTLTNDEKKRLTQIQPDSATKDTSNRTKALVVKTEPSKETPVAEVEKMADEKSADEKDRLLQDTIAKAPNEIITELPQPADLNKKDRLTSVFLRNTTPADSLFTKTTVIRKSESSTTEGFSLIFLDDYGKGKIDTVRILIQDTPRIKLVAEQPIEQSRVEKKFLDFVEDSTAQVTKTSPDTISQKSSFQKDSILQQPVKDTSKVVYQNNCIVTATDKDFLKLRKDMAAEMSDDAMIDVAKKEFRNKCYSVEQIKNLSTLFLTDEGKYKFFDASYSFVSDVGKFGVLQAELKDDYFINRFKAMLRD